MHAAAAVPPADLPALTVGVVDGAGTGSRAAEHLLATASPTAFVCASDSLALGALTTARSLAGAAAGRVPAVVGFDDTPVARAVGLTSVAQPLTEAAGRTIGQLLAQLAGDRPAVADADRHVLLCPSLVVRESSTRAPLP
jgi:DNA-binding LacI/PurR family transcriptional regulator